MLIQGVVILKNQKNIYNTLRLLLIVLGAIFIGVAFSPLVSAETIIVTPGSSGEDNPPEDDTPTVDYIECPEGFSCIKAEDYEQFISSLADFTKEINERTLFIEDVFDRFDKKIKIDEEYISKLTDIAETAQMQAEKFEAKLNEETKINDAMQTANQIKLNNLSVQVAELKAVGIWQFFLILFIALFVSELFQALKGHGKFIWRKIQEIVPWKF